MTPPPMPGTAIVFHHRSHNPTAGVAPRHKRAGGTVFYTRAICAGCNGGWMARLEQEVRPVLEPMIRGLWRELQPADQRLLAFWTIKTVLAFQTIESPVTTFARDDDFHDLYALQGPLPRAQVWLGAETRNDSGWYRAHSVRVPSSPPDGVDGLGATLVVGHALFYLLLGYDDSLKVRLRGEAAETLRDIWPGDSNARLWPPRITLDVRREEGVAPYVMEHSVLVAT
jgi:hypothetical protein